MEKLKNFAKKQSPYLLIVLIIGAWWLVTGLGLVPPYMLPTPFGVIKAFIKDFPLLIKSSVVTIGEALAGFVLAFIVGLGLAIIMDFSPFIEKAVTPLLLVTQTVPTIALAPLLILWLGLGTAPKIVLVFLTCFFPIAVGMLDGLKQADPDAIKLVRAMGADTVQVYRHIKLPGAMPDFFSGLRISAAYALVGAVVAEWIGGSVGLGVYMTRVRKSNEIDKMFAVILLISLLSNGFIQLIKYIEKKAMPWQHLNNKKGK